MTNLQATDELALHAACLTRGEYDAAGHNQLLSYDLARQAAQDRGHDLCINLDVDDRPDNAGAAMLRMIDDIRVRRGEPRRYKESYRPRVHVSGQS